MNSSGVSALYVAALNGHLEAFCTLLQHGARVDETDVTGKSPLDILQEKLPKLDILKRVKKIEVSPQTLKALRLTTSHRFSQVFCNRLLHRYEKGNQVGKISSEDIVKQVFSPVLLMLLE